MFIYMFSIDVRLWFGIFDGTWGSKSGKLQ